MGGLFKYMNSAGHSTRGGINTSRLRVLFLLSAVLLFGTHSAFATQYAVGTCKPSLHSFSTISAAVAAVPAGSAVLICPGVYPEQVLIAQPLTLEGTTSGKLNQVIIGIPPGGPELSSSEFASPMVAQVVVGAGPVNLTNVTVDGTGNNLTSLLHLAGIYYASGSSGVMCIQRYRDPFGPHAQRRTGMASGRRLPFDIHLSR